MRVFCAGKAEHGATQVLEDASGVEAVKVPPLAGRKKTQHFASSAPPQEFPSPARDYP